MEFEVSAEFHIDDDGYIRGVWDILNTPNGKILNTLCKYGTKIGISSRANGNVEEDYDGNQYLEIISPVTGKASSVFFERADYNSDFMEGVYISDYEDDYDFDEDDG